VSKQNINIERLQIRLKGVSPEVARAAADGLGSELLGRLSAPGVLHSHASHTGTNATHVKSKHLDAGGVRLSGATNAVDLRRRIAQSVVASINSKLKPRE
jgi:hypothetical protein